MDSNVISVGYRIRELRKSKGLTIEQLSEQVGKTANFIGNIERGVSLPSVETLVCIANTLNIGVDVILQDCLKIYHGNDKNKIFDKLEGLSKKEQDYILKVVGAMIDFKYM